MARTLKDTPKEYRSEEQKKKNPKHKKMKPFDKSKDRIK